MSQPKYAIPVERVRWNVIQDEAVLINVATSYYYSLNKTGTLVWTQLLERPRTLDELTQTVVATWKRDPAAARAELVAFLKHMLEDQLIIELPE